MIGTKRFGKRLAALAMLTVALMSSLTLPVLAFVGAGQVKTLRAVFDDYYEPISAERTRVKVSVAKIASTSKYSGSLLIGNGSIAVRSDAISLFTVSDRGIVVVQGRGTDMMTGRVYQFDITASGKFISTVKEEGVADTTEGVETDVIKLDYAPVVNTGN